MPDTSINVAFINAFMHLMLRCSQVVVLLTFFFCMFDIKRTHCDLCFRFEKVPLVTPNGDVLVKELNFEVS